MRPTALAAITALALLASAAIAVAETTREEYKAQVEPICKADKSASERYLSGVRKLVTEDKLKQASERFKKAAAALQRAEKQLAAVEGPAADAAKLGKWLTGIKGEIALMETIAAKLAAGEKGKASSLAVKLTHNANTTNNLVIGFQFDYCKIDPSQFT